jgi:hypothetical protein
MRSFYFFYSFREIIPRRDQKVINLNQMVVVVKTCSTRYQHWANYKFFWFLILLCPFLEGLFGQHVAKKQKIMRPSLDNSFDSATPVGGSAPSPVASQISNPNRLIKYFGGRDRGRKNKVLKVLLLSVYVANCLFHLFTAPD